MKVALRWIIFISYFSLCLVKLGAQVKNTALSIGISGGPTFTVGNPGQSENQLVGKIGKGTTIEFYGLYHISAKYAISGSILAQRYSDKIAELKLNSIFSGYSSQFNPEHRYTMFFIGLQRKYNLKNNEHLYFFVHPSVGAARHSNPYDAVYLRPNNGNIGYTSDLKNHWSPSFNLSSGLEYFVFRNLAINTKLSYTLSNAGTQEIKLTDGLTNQIYTFSPDLNYSWVHRISFTFGLTLHISWKKK